MPVKREISAKKMIQDIASGLEDKELMHTYRLTFKGLQRVYRKMIELKLIDPALLEGRIIPSVSTETTTIKRLPREEIYYFPLPVEDAQNRRVKGIITDINERGLRVQGLGVAVDEVKQLIIRSEKLFRLGPVHFEARCKWVKPSDDAEEILAGFEITAIAENELLKLKDLMEAIKLLYR